VIVYFNNIIIFSKDPELYNSYIQSIINKLIKAEIILKKKKYKFDTTIVKYFRMIYSTERL
jgi:hypothetical protein